MMDEFDIVLLEGIQCGFFDPSKVRERAALLNEKAIKSQSMSAFRDAWRLFHDSFSDNEAAVLNAISTAYSQCLHHLSPMDVNVTVAA